MASSVHVSMFLTLGLSIYFRLAVLEYIMIRFQPLWLTQFFKTRSNCIGLAPSCIQAFIRSAVLEISNGWWLTIAVTNLGLGPSYVHGMLQFLCVVIYASLTSEIFSSVVTWIFISQAELVSCNAVSYSWITKNHRLLEGVLLYMYYGC
jgi:hypothetical protein